MAPYTTSESLTGYFTTATPLAANLSDADISSQVQFFSFSAGQSTWNTTNAAYSGQRVSTDAQGHITAWLFAFYGESGFVNGVDMITCSGIPPAHGGCGNKYDVIFNDNSRQTDIASIFNSPGIWSGVGVGTPNGPSISATPAALNFQTPQGAAPPTQSLQIAGTPGAAWQAAATTSTGGNWLSLSPAAGTIPGSLTIMANSSSLAPGTYQGNITIQAPGVTPSSITVGVTLAVGGATYTYQGNRLNYFFGATGLSTSNFISAALTFSSPLPVSFFGDPGGTPDNNLTPKDQIMPIAWSISDGVHTLSSANGAALNYLELETDANGVIVSWYFIACATAICTSSAGLITAFNDPSSPGYVYDLYGYDYTGTSGELAYVKSNPGKWVLAAASTGSTAPSITPGGIVPVYSAVNTIQPGEWVSIYGANLASSTVTWTGNFPTSLGGTSVTIDGKPAYLSFVSPTQINVQAPDDTMTGSVPVVVTTASGTATATVTLAQFAPSFLLLDSKHVAGIIPRSDGSGAYGGGAYDILGPAGNSLGYPTVSAKAGDTVELFAVGLGPTNPAVQAGQAFSSVAPATNPVNLLINNVSVTPAFAGMSGAGLYQINLAVPAGLGTGDVPLVAIAGGAQTRSGVVVSLASSNSQCTDVSGTWSVSEAGSYTETIAAAIETDTVNPAISGHGNATIQQTGCSISYNPLSEPGLIGANLTPSQLASMTRTGTVRGNNVSVTGLLALIDTVGSARAGFTVTNVSSNVMNATGQVAGNLMTLTETGTFVATGNYSLNGQTGSFTETITTSSTALFARSGIITTVAGNGTKGFSGDGGPATSAEIDQTRGNVAADGYGNLFFADANTNRVRKVSASGTITTVAGNGTKGFSGDGGPAASAELDGPRGVAVDSSGNLFIADTYNNRIRKVSPNGIITTVAGIGPTCDGSSFCGSFSGDGGPATAATLSFPEAVAVDGSGNLFIADTENYRIRKVAASSGIITTVAGKGPASCGVSNPVCVSFSGDGGPATSALVAFPLGVAVDTSGNLFIVDNGNNRIRKVSANGIITTFAGTNNNGFFFGDGGPATSAGLYAPVGVAVDAYGNVYIADSGNDRIREVSVGGTITTVAGNGTVGFSGDGGLASSAGLLGPGAIAVDPSGNLFIADANRIRKVSLVGAPSGAAPSINQAGQFGVQLTPLNSSRVPLNIVISFH